MERPALQKLLADVEARQDRRHRRLQGRSPHPLAGRLRQDRRAVRRPRRLLRLGHPGLQHHHQHGPADPQRAAVVRPVRAGGHGREDPRQDRRVEEEGYVDGRRRSARLSGREPRAAHCRRTCRHRADDLFDATSRSAPPSRSKPHSTARTFAFPSRIDGTGNRLAAASSAADTSTRYWRTRSTPGGSRIRARLRRTTHADHRCRDLGPGSGSARRTIRWRNSEACTDRRTRCSPASSSTIAAIE